MIQNRNRILKKISVCDRVKDVMMRQAFPKTVIILNLFLNLISYYGFIVHFFIIHIVIRVLFFRLHIKIM